MIYKIKYSIFSLRELEWRIKQDTALRSSNYDSEAQYGVGTCLGSYKGYKLHLVASVDLPIAFEVTTAEVYNNQVSDILYDAKNFNPFLLLADAAYDDTE